MRAAYREFTNNVTTQASPESMATRSGLGRGVAAGLDALASASELAHGVAEQADGDDLTGPARALSRRAHNDVGAGLPAADLDEDRVWVSPADIVAKRLVPLPPPVIEGLLRVSAELAQNAMAASAAAQSQCQGRVSNIAEDVSTTEGRLAGVPVAPQRGTAFDRTR